MLILGPAENTKESCICTALPDSALYYYVGSRRPLQKQSYWSLPLSPKNGLLYSAPAGARHSGTSNPLPPCLQPLQQFYQPISTDKAGVKLGEYSIGLSSRYKKALHALISPQPCWTYVSITSCNQRKWISEQRARLQVVLPPI